MVCLQLNCILISYIFTNVFKYMTYNFQWKWHAFLSYLSSLKNKKLSSVNYPYVVSNLYEFYCILLNIEDAILKIVGNKTVALTWKSWKSMATSNYHVLQNIFFCVSIICKYSFYIFSMLHLKLIYNTVTCTSFSQGRQYNSNRVKLFTHARLTIRIINKKSKVQ